MRRVGDSDGEDFNVLRGDSVVVTAGGKVNKANRNDSIRVDTSHRDSNAQQYYNMQRLDSANSARKVSVYQYKGNEAYQIDDFDEDYGNEGNGRDR